MGHQSAEQLLNQNRKTACGDSFGERCPFQQLPDLGTSPLAHAEDEAFGGRVLEEPLNHATIIYCVVIDPCRCRGADEDQMSRIVFARHLDRRRVGERYVRCHDDGEASLPFDLGEQISGCFSQFHRFSPAWLPKVPILPRRGVAASAVNPLENGSNSWNEFWHFRVSREMKWRRSLMLAIAKRKGYHGAVKVFCCAAIGLFGKGEFN